MITSTSNWIKENTAKTYLHIPGSAEMNDDLAIAHFKREDTYSYQKIYLDRCIGISEKALSILFDRTPNLVWLEASALRNSDLSFLSHIKSSIKLLDLNHNDLSQQNNKDAVMNLLDSQLDLEGLYLNETKLEAQDVMNMINKVSHCVKTVTIRGVFPFEPFAVTVLREAFKKIEIIG